MVERSIATRDITKQFEILVTGSCNSVFGMTTPGNAASMVGSDPAATKGFDALKEMLGNKD